MKKRKFGLAMSLVLAAGTMLAACGSDDKGKNEAGEKPAAGNDGEKSEFSLAMVTDVGGIDDKSFNQSAWTGVKEFGEEQGWEKGTGGYDYLQSTGPGDYTTNLNNLARRDFNLIFGVGFLMEDAIADIAAQQKDTQFSIIDGEVDAPNVASILFKEQEGGYLAGVAAGLMTKSNKVGFIGGMDNPVIERFEAGFIEGVKAVKPEIKVDSKYVGAFDKAELGKAEAGRMYSSGVDIIFHAAGGTGNGVFSEAKERKQADKDAYVWVIGVDSDQYEEGKVGDDNVTLTSMLKRVDVAVKDIAKLAMEGNFPGGETKVYGLQDNGLKLADSRGAIPKEVTDQIDEYAQKIADGEIEVPEFVEKKK
ncbi:BMP family ABC transporter substrate-binding protein [Sporosarcina sp. P37]|uniref:BMP family lipoprotein n=1 Tax=unclassified Sporosarcina TaxID=2647733 RepID=UPI0009BFE742|nr:MULTISPECIES: BMP family protein [unclassified Sporosarcina]ARD49348.1 BMP family ABC transporter substrate-binding protein [Sporosarcina sp. P33]ARK25821.1 BMP family ABC transporter substrate-binding protein [Sporosarcina sp. P37]PID19155.1 BMP family ABC transporter substrate-binding protein [Sporosarcina sp. P35]